MVDRNSSYFETTYSQDERICKALEKEKAHLKITEKNIDQKRKQYFDEVTQLLYGDGLKIIYSSHLKIKFSFTPSEVVEFVSKKTVFYCTLKYIQRCKKWILKRDSLPVNYKWTIYKMFYSEKYFIVDDESVIVLIMDIILKLQQWAFNEEKRLVRRYQKYLKGDDMILDSEDEELFLNEEQKQELHRKRTKILKRMLPPKRKRHV